MKDKWIWLEKYAPLGIGVKRQVGAYIGGMVMATLYSMHFLIVYMQARSELYIRTVTGVVLKEGAVIRDFGALTQYVFLSFYILGSITGLTIVFFYFYHYEGSKMLYLMKRLPQKWELCKRCVTLPSAGLVILVVWMGILKMIYYTIYIVCTPSQCLPLPI